jgi:chromosome segregation ATPase
MSTKSKRPRGNYSPASAAAVLDHRVVIVKSDQARSRLADFAAFIQGIEEERDTAVGKVCDLETSVRELESDNERIAVLENDVAYWRTDREEQKLAKENFEMDLRRSKDEIQRLNAVIASNGRELEANKKVHKTKDIQIDKLTTENMRLRSEMAASDSEHKDILAQLNARLLEKNSHCQQMSEALNAALIETKRIQASLADTRKSPKVGKPAIKWNLIHLEISGVQDGSSLGANDYCKGVRNRMIHRNKFQFKITHLL